MTSSINPSPPGLPFSSQPNLVGGSLTTLHPDLVPDQLSQLQQLVLKTSTSDPGIAFPGLAFKEKRSNSLAIHRYPNVAGAHVENVGENEGHYFVRAILSNNIYPSPNETWAPGNLFPTVYIALLNLLRTSADKVFQHPLYGNITVQVATIDCEMEPDKIRDGMILDFELVETVGTANIQATISNPASNATSASARALDQAISGPDVSLIPGLTLAGFFTSLTNTIMGVLATPNALIGALNQQINSVVSSIQVNTSNLSNTISYTSNFTNFSIYTQKNSVYNATIQNASYDPSAYAAMNSLLILNNTTNQNASQLLSKTQQAISAMMLFYINQNNAANSLVIETLKQYLYQIQQVALNVNANSSNNNNPSAIILGYVTTMPMSWMTLATFLNNDISDLLALNQSLINDLSVPSGVQVFYYSQSSNNIQPVVANNQTIYGNI